MHNVKIIDINKGFEDRFLIETKLNDKNKFFYNAYKRSAEIINEICLFNRSSGCDNKLFGNHYPNNIIMYCAERGGGKTTAMLSVANSLANISEDDNGIACLLNAETRECRFSVIPPIDPTSISADESFMRIVLSRLFSELRLKWEQEDKKNNFSGDMRLMYERGEVVEKFTECYKLLNAIDAMHKKKEVDPDSDLDKLTELGDFSRLKNKFMNLVDCYLKHMHSGRKSYLVIPIDDADLNSQKSFEIIEDIRKYCILPNIIVLMAANMEQMHQVIEQHYIIEFKPFLDYSDNSAGSALSESQKPLGMAVRYLNKVLPSTHQIRLPAISDFILNNSSQLGLKYTDLSGSEEPDKLSYPSQDYQERLINLIHKKTGVGLVKPNRYLHNFIPGNMRDLTHFLSYFDALPDLKNYGYADFYASVLGGGENIEMQDEIEKRLSNLDALQVYFIYNWCDNNLTQENYQMISKLAYSAETLKISSAVNIISEYIQKLNIQDDNILSEKPRYTYANLMRLISFVSENAKSQNDFMQIYKLVFALRMFFTIFLHREMLSGIKNRNFEWLYSITGGILWHFDYEKMFGKGHKDFGHFEVSVKALKQLYDIPDNWEQAKLSPNFKNLMTVLSKYCYILENGEYTRIGIPTDPKDIKPIDDKTIFFDTSVYLLTFLTSPELYSSDSGQLACLNHLYDVLLNWEVFHQTTKYAERTEITETDQYDPVVWHSALINLLCGKYNKLPKYDPSIPSLLDMPYLENELPDADTKLALSVDPNILYANINNTRSVINALISQMRAAVDDMALKNPPESTGDTSTSAMVSLKSCIDKLRSMEKLIGSHSEIDDLDEKLADVYRYAISALITKTKQFGKNDAHRFPNDDIDRIYVKTLDDRQNMRYISNLDDSNLGKVISPIKNSRDGKPDINTLIEKESEAEDELRQKINSQKLVDKIMNGVYNTFGIETPKRPHASGNKEHSGSNEAKGAKRSAKKEKSEQEQIGAKTDENAKEPSEDSVQPDTAGTPAKRTEGTK